LLDRWGNIKILHFGYIAQLLQAGEARHPEIYAYVAPELVQHNVADKRSDIYSLGAILYHLLTSKAPVDEERLDILKLRQTLPPPSSVSARVPGFFDAIVQKCMAENPALRYSGVEELEDELIKEWNLWLRAESNDEESHSKSLLIGFWTLVALAVAASAWVIVQELFFGEISRPLEEATLQERNEVKAGAEGNADTKEIRDQTEKSITAAEEETLQLSDKEEFSEESNTTLLNGTQLQAHLLVDNLVISRQGGLLEHKIKAVNLNTLQALSDIEVEVRYLDNTGEVIDAVKLVFEELPPGGKAEQLISKELPQEAKVEVRVVKAILHAKGF
jgi:serine/threonine protein kinase